MRTPKEKRRTSLGATTPYTIHFDDKGRRQLKAYQKQLAESMGVPSVSRPFAVASMLNVVSPE